MPRLLLACLLVLSAAAVERVPTPRVTAPPLADDHSELAIVLARVAKPDGVDYAVLRSDPEVRAALARYRVQLARVAEPTDRAAKLALYINAYNALTLALVADKLPAETTAWPTWSIRQAGGVITSVWKAYDFEVAGRRLTLDAIEHAVLRPLGEPRIHIAINCASRSCPPLLATPFLAASLEPQLDAATRAFVADPYHVRVVDGTLTTNPILEWFKQDFAAGGGVPAFLRQHAAPGPVAELLDANRPLRFFDYDWSLNRAGVAP